MDSPDYCARVNRKQRATPEGVLTDGSDMVNGIMLRPFCRQEPLEILGRIALRLALEEVVQITNRVCHEIIEDT